MHFTESFISVPILALYSTRDITSNLSSAKMATKRFTIIPTKHHKDCSYYVEQQKSVDANEIFKRRQSRTDNTMAKRKRTQRQTMIFRIQHETPQTTRGEPTNII